MNHTRVICLLASLIILLMCTIVYISYRSYTKLVNPPRDNEVEQSDGDGGEPAVLDEGMVPWVNFARDMGIEYKMSSDDTMVIVGDMTPLNQLWEQGTPRKGTPEIRDIVPGVAFWRDELIIRVTFECGLQVHVTNTANV